MNKIFASIVLITATGSFCYGQVIVNPSFELTPPFTGWVTTGDVNLWTSANGINPTDGVRYAQMSTAETAGAVSAASEETFLGLASGTLATQGGGTAGEGSAIKQLNITVGAADVGKFLTFNWNLITQDAGFPNLSEKDYGFFTLSGPTSFFGKLADIRSATTPSDNAIFDLQTGWNTGS